MKQHHYIGLRLPASATRWQRSLVVKMMPEQSMGLGSGSAGVDGTQALPTAQKRARHSSGGSGQESPDYSRAGEEVLQHREGGSRNRGRESSGQTCEGEGCKLRLENSGSHVAKELAS